MSDPVIRPPEGASLPASRPSHGVATAQGVVRAYHQRTKHQLQRFAAGPDTLDWDAQPDPFRQWAGSPVTMLPLVADTLPDTLAVPWADLAVPHSVAPQPMSKRSLAAMLELALGLTAWKQFGPDRWALRANPSSGNLHPTEAYALCLGWSQADVDEAAGELAGQGNGLAHGLADGLYHYAPREHALALRATPLASAGKRDQQAEAVQGAALWIGLSSVQWREAWKYGERAFRYCQLDAGHALGAVRYAAAVLGWQARVVPGLSHAQLATMLGLSRDVDFGRAEREEPELLIQVGPDLSEVALAPTAWLAAVASDAVTWQGQASLLDRHPMYRWPIIDEVAQATRAVGGSPMQDVVGQAATATGVLELGASAPSDAAQAQALPVGAASASGAALGASPRSAEPASSVIRGRRSAQHFDRRASMSLAAFWRMAQALMPAAGMPWDAWPHTPRVHVVFFAHRVDGLAPGAYVLPRSDAGAQALPGIIHTGSAWQKVAGAPTALPLFALTEHPALAGTLRTLSCHQAIASDACFALSLLAEFDAHIDAASSSYRDLYQEAGLIGQALYLQAEAEGLRGTGIGCYFDDAVHELLGIKDQRTQVLYHFTVGVPTVDTRISTEPPYANRSQVD